MPDIIDREPATYRDLAERLRGLAQQTPWDVSRVDKLQALARGFERVAQRLEYEEASEVVELIS